MMTHAEISSHLAFFEIIERTPEGFIARRLAVCPSCVALGYYDRAHELVAVDDYDKLVDEGRYLTCNSCCEPLHCDDIAYDPAAIGVAA